MTKIARTVYEAVGSAIEGDVTIGEESSVWFNAVIRGDEDRIAIGARSNIQDNATVHEDAGYPVVIGDDVTIGHNAIVHGCTIGDNSLIGMGAIILNGAKIGRDCIIGAGALVTQGTEIPDGSMAFGSPAKVVRACTEEEIAANSKNARVYVDLAREARTGDLIDAVSPGGE